jgi:hypothetical protein
LGWPIQPADVLWRRQPYCLIGLPQEGFGLWFIDWLGGKLGLDVRFGKASGFRTLFWGESFLSPTQPQG